MNTLVKLHRKGQVTLPSQFRSAAGMSEGDLIEVSLVKGKIVLTRKVVIDKASSNSPTANSEYSKAEQRAIDASLAKSAEDIRKGRVYGPFGTAKELAASVESEIRKLRVAKSKSKAPR